MILVTAVLAAAPAASQTTVPCAGLIDLTQITEPWEQYSRSYAEGAIRVFEAYLDPNLAAGAVIGVIHPVPGDPYPLRTCTAVLHADPDARYFGEALIAEATASYDPARGLTVRVPVRFPDFAQPIEAVTITINQATGEVTAE
jgi:hypothetical protein